MNAALSSCMTKRAYLAACFAEHEEQVSHARQRQVSEVDCLQHSLVSLDIFPLAKVIIVYVLFRKKKLTQPSLSLLCLFPDSADHISELAICISGDAGVFFL